MTITITITGIVSILVLIFVFGYKEYRNKLVLENQKKFEADFNAARFEIENHNYINAVKIYNDMLHSNDNLNNFFQIKKQIGLCYMVQGNIEQGEKQNLYFDNAISTFQEILSMDDVFSKEQLLELQYYLAMTYIFYENETYEKELKVLINLLEDKLNENANLPFNKDEGYFLLGMFYESRFYKDYKSEDFEKAKEYFVNALEFEVEIENLDTIEKGLSLLYKENAAYFYLRHANHISVNLSTYSYDEMVYIYNEDLRTAILIYEDLLSVCSYDIYPDIYFRNVKDLGRCYILLDEKEKAYDEFKKFIYLDREDLDPNLSGSYLFTTLELNQEDIDILLKRYYRLVDYYIEISDINEMCEAKLELLSCYYVLYNKQKNIDYYKKGREILDELNNKYYGYYNTKRDGIIEEYNELYNENGKNINDE